MTAPTVEPLPFDFEYYRQPLVTSLGVMLGFPAPFLAQWMSDDAFHLGGAPDRVLFTGEMGGVAMLLWVLVRTLSFSVERGALSC